MISYNNNTNATKEPKLNKKNMMPTPYGSIPKRNKKLSLAANKKTTTYPARKHSLSTPYPCFSLAPTSSSFFISVFNNLFNNKETKEEKPVGFMPCSTDKIQMSQLVDIAVNGTNPIDCHYGDSKEQDNCSSISGSSSSSESSTSSPSSIFSYYMDSFDDDNSSTTTTTTTADSISTDILSDILCDHYVQTQKNNPPSLSDNNDMVDVPLETFRMFEAPPTNTMTDDNWMSIDELDTKEWKLIETKKDIIVQIKKEENIPPVETDDVSLLAIYHTRDIRANAAYLRMIVAEVNMMRNQKIVGPLRPRRVLPKRLDSFMHRPSPLQSVTA